MLLSKQLTANIRDSRFVYIATENAGKEWQCLRKRCLRRQNSSRTLAAAFISQRLCTLAFIRKDDCSFAPMTDAGDSRRRRGSVGVTKSRACRRGLRLSLARRSARQVRELMVRRVYLVVRKEELPSFSLPPSNCFLLVVLPCIYTLLTVLGRGMHETLLGLQYPSRTVCFVRAILDFSRLSADFR